MPPWAPQPQQAPPSPSMQQTPHTCFDWCQNAPPGSYVAWPAHASIFHKNWGQGPKRAPVAVESSSFAAPSGA